MAWEVLRDRGLAGVFGFMVDEFHTTLSVCVYVSDYGLRGTRPLVF